jgi:hypothetical protein
MTFSLRFVVLLFCAAAALNGVATAQLNNATMSGFIQNAGQWPEHVLFVAQQHNARVWITRSGVVVDEYTIDDQTGTRTGIVTREHFQFSTSNAAVSSAPSADVQSVNFFRGNDKALWVTAPVVQSVMVQIESGVQHMYSRASDGRVQRTVVASADRRDAFMMKISGAVSKNQPSEVSPVTSTVYGSYAGGAGKSVITGVEYLSNGDVIVCGTAIEMAFPNSTGGYASLIKGTSDGFVVRFDSKLQRARSFTFIGGSGDDRIRAICRDPQNAIYVAGETTSNDFPTTSGVSGKLFKAGVDGFLAKFDSTLQKLVIGLYHGGNKDDFPRAVSAGENGLIYLAGYTNSTTNFPVTFPATITITIPGRRGQPPTYRTEPGGGTNMGQIDGFIASFSANGAVQQSRFFGRENNEYITSMAVDRSNSVYLTGSTTSANFETAPTADRFDSGRLPFDNSFNGGTTDAFVIKLNNELALAKSDDGTYSAFFGGNKEDEGRSICVDDLGRAYIVGVTTSTNLNAVGTLTTQAIGKQDVFLAVVSNDGRELVGSTYYGGTGDEEPFTAKIVEGSSSVVIAGTTNSEDFPFAGEGLVTERSGNTDGFLAVINLSTNQYATLISGNQDDTVKAVSVGPYGSPYYVASTTSTNLRVQDSSYNRANTGGLSGYVAKHAFGVLELTAPTGGETYCVGISKPISWSALGMPDTTKFRIEYAAAGSNVWQDVAKNVAGRSYSWKVPTLPTGDYVLRITTIYGHVSRLLTPFSISSPPAIDTQPKNVSACPGKSVTMSLVAKGAGLKYQWRKAGVNIPNATDASYTIPSLDAGALGKYDCLVSGTCSPSVTSQAITVATATPTEITKQPQANTVVDAGASFSLSVTAGGSDLEYKWLKNGVAIENATAAQYVVAAATKSDEGQYTCEVTGGCGKITSTPATVVVQGGTSVDEEGVVPENFADIVGPQPAQDVLMVKVDLASSQELSMLILALDGRVIAQQVFGQLAAGSHVLAVSTSACAQGSYNLQFRAGKAVSQHQIQIIR